MALLNEPPPPTSSEERGCLQCRLLGGTSFVVAAGYVLYYSKNVKGLNKFGMLTFSAGLGALGVARFLNLSPFKLFS